MAPMNRRVIAIVTAMLETLETSPDTPDAEVEELVKQTLQLISGRKPSTIRALGDAFMNFAEDKPWLAATIVITIWAVPQKIIEEAWRSVYPPKVQIEVQDPTTGQHVPWNDSSLHALTHTTATEQVFAEGLGIEYDPIGYQPQRGIVSDEAEQKRHGETVRLVTNSGRVYAVARAGVGSVCGGDCEFTIGARVTGSGSGSGRSREHSVLGLRRLTERTVKEF